MMSDKVSLFAALSQMRAGILRKRHIVLAAYDGPVRGLVDRQLVGSTTFCRDSTSVVTFCCRMTSTLWRPPGW